MRDCLHINEKLKVLCIFFFCSFEARLLFFNGVTVINIYDKNNWNNPSKIYGTIVKYF